MGSYSVTCHPAEVTFPPLPQPIKAGTRFSDPREGCKAELTYSWLGYDTCRSGIPARRRSPIPELIELSVTPFMRRPTLPPRQTANEREQKKLRPRSIAYARSTPQLDGRDELNRAV